MTGRPGACVGVDGYSGGWVAVSLDGRGAFARAWAAGTLSALLADLAPGTPVGIDIPLGGVPAGWRTADLVAQQRLGARRSTVFRVPPRPLWELPYPQANAELKRLTGGGLSKQAWHLIPKMLQAEAQRDAHQLYEVHPELAFAGMAAAPVAPKKTWAGQARRRALLAEVGIVLPDDIGAAGMVPPDDLLDAAGVAWCVHRMARGEARHVPDPPDQYDEHGRPILIWY